MYVCNIPFVSDDIYILSFEVTLQNDLSASLPVGCSNSSSIILLNAIAHVSTWIFF